MQKEIIVGIPPTRMFNSYFFAPGYTGVMVFIGSKVQCLFCFETSTKEGRGEEMGGSGNFKNKVHRTFDPRNNSTPVQESRGILKNFYQVRKDV